ncbi:MULTISPECIES: MFS transporter [Pseudomonas]|uniref:MFS transporter n=1 Tax=Pseudomonas TaxID=286 RepID=UPI0002F4DB06|nr:MULTISPECIES: MFS transporter [Pseudomonas]WOB59383.1 MFS transporter [Pseudomonas sp. NBB]
MNPALTRWITLLLAITSAMAVATVYFAQPLLESMAADLGVAQQQIGWVVGATQAGYALGLLLIVPLGDLIDRKRLLLGQLLFSALALVGVGMAPNWALLLLALAITGLMAVMVQVMVAHAASLAAPGQQGQAVGTVTSGIVLGILLARLVSGGLADLAGWRSVYLFTAGLLMLLAGRGAMASRLIGAYMCCYSLGSGVGAVLASWVYAHWGWAAVCGLGMGISAVALGYWLWLQRARAAEAALQCSGQNL